jgi:hypothetical protein
MYVAELKHCVLEGLVDSFLYSILIYINGQYGQNEPMTYAMLVIYMLYARFNLVSDIYQLGLSRDGFKNELLNYFL